MQGYAMVPNVPGDIDQPPQLPPVSLRAIEFVLECSYLFNIAETN
jgi:hypothetical protein